MDDTNAMPRWPTLSAIACAALVTAALYGSGAMNLVERRAQDALHKRVPPVPAHPALRIIEIGGRDLKALGAWPWPWKYHALLVHALGAAGCKAVVYDVPLPEKGAEDAAYLVQAAGASGTLWLSAVPVLAREAAVESVPLSRELLKENLLTEPLPEGLRPLKVQEVRFPYLPALIASAGAGLRTAPADEDGVVRRVPLVVSFGPSVYAAWPLRIAGWLKGSAPRLEGAGVDGAGRMMLSASKPVPSAGFVEVLDLFREDPAALDPYKDKVVIVGLAGEGAASGAGVLAAAANTLLAGGGPAPLGRWAGVLLLTALCLSAAPLADRARPWKALLGAVLGGVAYGGVAFLVLSRWRLMLPLSYAAAALLLSTAAVLLLKFTQAEEEKRRLRAIDGLKSEFVHTVSHELRSPLSNIQSYVDLFLSEGGDRLTPEHKGYFRTIMNQIARLTDFINEILDLAKIEAGQVLLRKRVFSLSETARSAVELGRASAQAKGVSVALEAPEKSPAFGDPDKLAQVLINLLANALKFTPAGGRIGVRVFPGGDRWSVEVRDTGPGIPDDHLARVFDKFHQVSSGGLKPTGTGLGLSIVKQLLDLHGESVHVESRPGRGAAFTFTVSRALKEVADA